MQPHPEHELCWAAFAAALRDRDHPFRTPVVLSIDEQGYPSGRVLTLRAIDPDSHWLRFHIDQRSPKFQHWQARPIVSAVFYDKAAKWQIRVRGVAQLHANDAIARDAWERSHPMCQRTYLSDAAPGTPLDWDDNSTFADHLMRQRPTPQEAELGFSRFAVLLCRIADMDSLHLAGTGHQRFHIDAPSAEIHRLAP
jgi:pyridoxamine 5'-phosphate oxidase